MASSAQSVSPAFVAGLASTPSNPPLHHHSHVAYNEPLVLYIARVPGSRDVILTPIKPREITITAEDINSCVYYLHAHSSDDDLHSSGSSSPESADRPPLPPPHRISPSANSGAHLSQQQIRRAWTNHPNYPLGAEECQIGGEIPSTLRIPQPVQSTAPLIKRKPVPQSISPLSVRANSNHCYNSDAGRYQQQLQNQLQNSSASTSPPYPIHDVFPDPENWKPTRRADRSHEVSKPKLTASPIREQAQSIDHHIQIGGSVKPVSNSPTSPPDPARVFTLIKREPATGEQWNVAKISKSKPTAVYLSTMPLTESIEITMENSGYKKLAGSPQDLEHNVCGQTQSGTHGGGPFKRTLQMEESLFSKLKFGHGRAKSHEMPPTNYSAMSFQSTSPTETSASAHNLLPNLNDSLGPAVRRTKRAKHVYSFTSPWNGRCEFSATMGDSLKCKHATGGSLASPQESTLVTVSELRFNLPAAMPALSADTGLSRRSRFLGRFKQKLEALGGPAAYARRGSEPIISTSTLDLSLGLELAGGGFSGKKAKMGKLIVEHEGLKMLDLLIAANLSLWWKAYEKR